MEINTDAVLQEIDKVGQYLSEKLQVPVEKAYEILMKQIWFDFSIALFWLIIGIGVLIFAILSFRKLTEYIETLTKSRNYSFSNPTPDYNFKAIVWMVFEILSFIISPFMIAGNVYIVLQIAINPEWYMIQMIMEKIQ